VFEFDIKGFFNNVKIPEVIRLLRKLGMPQEQYEFLNKLLFKAPGNLELSNPPKNDYDIMLATRAYMEQREQQFKRPAPIGSQFTHVPVYLEVIKRKELPTENLVHYVRKEKEKDLMGV